MPVKAPCRVVCRECGVEFDMSARNVRWRRAKRGGVPPLCRSCRWAQRERSEEEERERLRRWWLEESGLSVEELLEIGEMLGWV